MPIRNVWFER